eukprot:COSAG01_NODE_58540_length_305_cov_1.063107_1_plen_37_part_10
MVCGCLAAAALEVRGRGARWAAEIFVLLKDEARKHDD